MISDASPTARALMALELIQNGPGITADRLAHRLEVSARAVRRYVGILREAGVPIESERGPYGGYRTGRGLRLPPLMFTNTEALALVMSVLEGRHEAADPEDPVGSALGKILRVLPESVAAPAQAIRTGSARHRGETVAVPSPETTAVLVQACAAHRRVRIGYRLAQDPERTMELDPWAVVVRRGYWYLLCWSHTRDARRVLRVDRVGTVDVLADTFTPPPDLDPVRTLEEHLSEGWTHQVEVVFDAPLDAVGRCLPRTVGRLTSLDDGGTRLNGSTNQPEWYVGQLLETGAPFHILEPPALQEAARLLAQRLLVAVDPGG